MYLALWRCTRAPSSEWLRRLAWKIRAQADTTHRQQATHYPLRISLQCWRQVALVD